MVVCAMQSFATEQQLDSCSAMKSAQTTQIKDAGIVDNGNGAEEEDREEGEIVDEFEMIISSEDEEFKLRARIQQLEDKSKDIEKMDMLSANLADQYNYQRPHRIDRYTQYQHFSPISVLSDVSSLSEEEFEPPKKYRKHKAKRMEAKKHGPQLRRNPFAHRSQRQDHPYRRKRRHEHNNNHYQQQQAAILLDSLDSVTEDEMGEYDVNVENENDDYEELEQLKLSRNKLRVALARTANYDIKPKHSLKERLQYRMRKSPSPSTNSKENQLKQKEDLQPYSFEGYTQERSKNDDVKVAEEEKEQQEPHQQLPQIDEPPELKLRIIALKSAILKKHMARKKRDAERAYSPTDMINRVHQPTVSNECDDIDDLMEISPAASPERTTFSPPAANFEEPVDMDLAQTDSDEDRQQWPHNWQSTVNRDESWRCFLPNSLPPVSMPIVIDDDEEQQEYQRKQEQFDDADDEVPPPPPSFHIPHMQLEDDDARDALHLSEQHSQHGSLIDIQSISMDNSQTQTATSRTFQAESSEDEAGALRAMLLSRFKPTNTVALKEEKPIALQKKADSHDSDDPDELRLLLLSSIASKKKSCPEESPVDSPEILKNAVRRFQVTSLQTTEVSSTDATGLEMPLEPDKETVTSMQQQSLIPFSLPDALPQPVPMPVPMPMSMSVPAPLPVPPPKLPEEVCEVASIPMSTKPTIHASSTDIIKIVKPNKVINKKTAPKRKILKLAQPTLPLKRPATLLIKESVAPLHAQNGGSSTRLITTLDPASIKVNKLVIALAESSAGSDDELELRRCYASYTNYADNPSPFSQAMDSASNSTTRSNTPNSEILESSTAPSNSNLRRTVINEYFEKKLDDFLKQARSKVPTPSPLAKPTVDGENAEKTKPQSKPTQKAAPVQQSNKAKPTPVAVRHLPVASQKEYLRLIERMQLLEKKKIVGTVKGTGSKKDNATRSTVEAKSALTKKEVKKTVTEATANGTEETNKASDIPTTSKMSQKMPSKESRLKAFESSFLKIGGSMITNLEKSLRMVEEAKLSKIARLRYSHRFEELFSEMQSVKQAMKLEEAKLSRIQPEIQASHEIIISLKQKRNKLRNAAMDLGSGLQGPDYRLLDPGKAEIMRKSTQLTKEIRLYNSIVKYEDIVALDAESTSTKEPQPEPESQSVPTTEITPQSIESSRGSSDSQKEAENENEISIEQEELMQKQQPIECDSVEVAIAGDDAVTIERETQLDSDITPRDLADDVPNSISRTLPVQDVPPYTVSFMRELCASPAGKEESLLGEYRTPMSRNYNSQLNVNATVCPFELMGRCEDVDCSYLHLTRVESESTATASVAAQ
ncbi:hypothetical protein ACLKA6_019983 [Drosophila palustris]